MKSREKFKKIDGRNSSTECHSVPDLGSAQMALLTVGLIQEIGMTPAPPCQEEYPFQLVPRLSIIPLLNLKLNFSLVQNIKRHELVVFLI